MSVSVSETIGKLLLEGYKMLADSCEVCCTVLMQDRRGRIICVQCESKSLANAAQMDVRPTSGKIANGSGNTPSHFGSANSANQDVNTSRTSGCEEVLTKEIQNTAQYLQNQPDMQLKLLYLRYIRECAETIQILKGIQNT